MPSPLRPSRRSFLRSAGAVATTVWTTGPAILRAQPRDALRLALIGVGGRGADNLESVSTEHIAAICDVDRTALDKAAAAYPKARKAADFRQLFDHAGEFDAVVVSTAEHTHAFATLPALQLKKHVYCEKPLTYNVEEARIIREAAAGAGVATQMGTQIHASDNYRRVVELVQSGAIGAGERVPCVGLAGLGLACQRGGVQGGQRHRLRAGAPGGGGAGSADARLGSVAGPGARAPVPRRLRAGAEVVSLVGLRQRDDERPGQPLDRPALLGAEARGAVVDRGKRPAAARGDRAGVDAGDATSTRRRAISRG